ncbi:hypothetical protein Tco_0633997 [Tanacetum coccineum]
MSIGISHEDVISSDALLFLLLSITLASRLGCLAQEVSLGMRSQGSSLWSRLIKALYGDRVSLDGTGSVSRPSLWNNIIRELGSLSLKGINLHSHNGAHTLFWEDSWITDSPLRQTYSQLYALENVKHVSIADKLSDVSLIDSFRRAPRDGLEEEQYLSLMDLVASVILSNSNDRWVWAFDSAGEFTVKSSCTFIDDSLLPTVGSLTRWVKIFLPLSVPFVIPPENLVPIFFFRASWLVFFCIKLPIGGN